MDLAAGALSQLSETVFIGGLGHDIGKLFLLRVLDEMGHGHRQGEAVSSELVREVLDNAHGEVGYRLLQSWHLPEVHQNIVRDHHAEQADRSNVALQIVRLANHACNKVGISLAPEPGLVLSALSEASALGMTEISIAELEIILEDVMAQTTAAALYVA